MAGIRVPADLGSRDQVSLVSTYLGCSVPHFLRETICQCRLVQPLFLLFSNSFTFILQGQHSKRCVIYSTVGSLNSCTWDTCQIISCSFQDDSSDSFRFVLSTSCSKLSILILYRRVISGVVNYTFIGLVNCAIALLVLYAVVFTFLMVFQCRPASAFWLQYSFPQPYTDKFSCIDASIVPLANACVSVVTDFMAAILPMFLFRQLHIPKREKLGLGIVFGVGFL